MSKSRWVARKYNATELKHRQRLLMLTDLCIAANLLLGWALSGGKGFMLGLGVGAFILAIVSRTDAREEMNGNVRIVEVTLLFITLIVFLTLHRRFFWIVGAAEALCLIVFAAWPYRKLLFKRSKRR